MKARYLLSILLLLAYPTLSQVNTWTGAVSRDWHTTGNWSLGHVPNSSENVTIPSGTTYTPRVDEDCDCADLTLQASAELEIGPLGLFERLDVYGDFHIHGNIIFSDTTSLIVSRQDCYWEAGSSIIRNCTIPHSRRPTFYAYGDLNFESGSTVDFDTMNVVMSSSSAAILRINSPDTRFFILHIDKQNASVTLSASTTEDLVISDVLYISDDPILNSFISLSNQDIIIGSETDGGRLGNNGGTLQMNGGTLRLYARSSINANFGDSDIVNNLTLHSLSPFLEVNGSPDILGDLIVDGNPLEFADHVTLEGHLSNELDDPATLQFNLLTFQGSSLQTVYQSLDCDSLMVNKTASEVRLLTGNMNCNHYDWMNGGINVLGGTFTADDLIDGGLFGKWWLSPGGTINLTNNDGFVDLNAEIHIYGGNFNIYGGTDDSYWGYAADCLLDMDDGILDFKDRGIHLDNSYNVDDDISGGVIRTTRGFNGTNRSDFNPAAGTFEFYGTSDQYINQGSGNTFHSIGINKATADGPGLDRPVLKHIPRSSQHEPPGGENRSNTITLASDLHMTGDLLISSGILDVSSSNYNIYIQGNWTNNAGDAGFVERAGIVEFQGGTNSQILTDETFFNLKENKTSTSFLALELGNGNGNGVDVNILSTLILADGEIELNSPCTLSVGYMLQIEDGAELNANDAGTIHLMVGQNWVNNNPPGTGFYPGSASIVEFNSTNAAMAQFIKEASYFNDIIVNSNAPEVRPESSAGFGIIQCQDMDILAGRLSPGGDKVIVDGILTIHDELELSHAEDTLIVNDIIWKSGSDDIISAGRIMVGDDWIFEFGTNAHLDPANITEFYLAGNSLIECFSPIAGFGSVLINKPPGTSANTYIYGTSTNPMRVFGDMTVKNGNHFYLDYADLAVAGNLIHEAGSEILMDGNSLALIEGNLDINGTLDIGSGDVIVHDFFDLESTGTLILDGGSLITDTPNASPYWCYFRGTLNMTAGIIEATYNNHRFTSTFSGSISGGTFRVGGAFDAADNVFQPTGGTVEFINGSTHYIQPASGNWFFDLHLNNNGLRELMNPLTVKNDVLITSGGLDCNSHDIFVGGDWTNNAGAAAFEEASGTVRFNGDDPVNAQHIYGETFYNLTNNNYAGQLEISGSTIVTNDFNTGGVGAKSLVTSASLDIQHILDLSDATLTLASSGPDVDVESFIQGGILEVNGGSFTVNDLIDSYLKGTYNITDGVVDISQDGAPGSFVDLKADITMLGGELYVRGGTLDYSRWTGVPDPLLTMAPGSIMDFTDAGIYVQDNNFIEDISGGLVRCKGMININATNFTPTGGTFEIYGEVDNYVRHSAGSYFYNFNSNLDASCTLYPLTDIEVKAELTVSSGTFHTNGYTVSLGD